MESEFKALANKYFEGRIAPEEENALLSYISQNAEAMAAFRNWEAEWSSRPHFDMVTDSAWNSFSNWMRSRNNHSRRMLWRVAAAVVLLVLMGGSALVGRYVATSAPESYCMLTAPMGSKTRLTLPDGSIVWLNAGSTLSYSTRFADGHRRVKLDGQGYFEVAKRNGAEFVVNTRGYDVVVKGTRFDVSAYADDQFITTTLLQGAVVIDRDEDMLSMKPGDMVSLDMRTGKFTKSRFNTDTHAWIEDKAEYSDITLERLAKLLSRRYAVNVNVTSEQLRHVRFSISLRNKETIDDVLDALQRITSMQVCRDGKEIVISSAPGSGRK